MHYKVLLKPDQKSLGKKKQKSGKEVDTTKPRKKPNQTKNCLVFLICLLQLRNQVGLEKQLQVLLAHSVRLLGSNYAVFTAHK